MTNEQINAAIAEACGWTAIWGEGCDPDYCGDLNEMHEAEKVLRNQFTTIEEAYWRNLQWVKPHPIYATARQRAEAFLRALGKWEKATDKESLTVGGATTEQSSVDHLRDATKMMEEVQDAPQ
jgi:hypothetical protein